MIFFLLEEEETVTVSYNNESLTDLPELLRGVLEIHTPAKYQTSTQQATLFPYSFGLEGLRLKKY